MSTTTEKTEENLDRIDNAILALAKHEPNLTKRQLGLKLKELGAVKHQNTVYKRLKKSDYLRSELAEIERKINEELHRDLYPLASKRVKHALKSKEYNDLQVKEYVKLVFDKVHGENHINYLGIRLVYHV